MECFIKSVIYITIFFYCRSRNEVGQLLHLQPLSGTESTDLLYAADAGL